MKNYEIWKDDLGRWCVHCKDSPYSKESDHKIYHSREEAARAAERHRETGQWESNFSASRK